MTGRAVGGGATGHDHVFVSAPPSQNLPLGLRRRDGAPDLPGPLGPAGAERLARHQARDRDGPMIQRLGGCLSSGWSPPGTGHAGVQSGRPDAKRDAA